MLDDQAAATEFFVELGRELQGEGPVEGCWVDRGVGLAGVRAEVAMLQTPERPGRLELTKFNTPPTRPPKRPDSRSTRGSSFGTLGLRSSFPDSPYHADVGRPPDHAAIRALAHD